MNRIYLKLYFVKSNKTIEVIFDSRFSFINNFRLLKSLLPDLNIDEFYIYDKDEAIFLDKTLPIKEFKIHNLSSLCVF